MKHRAFLIIMSIVAMGALLLTACSSLSPSETTGKALDAVKTRNVGELQKYCSGNLLEQATDSLKAAVPNMDTESATQENQAVAAKVTEVLADFDYELGTEKIEGDSATVEVTISSHDLKSVLADSVSDYFKSAIGAAFSGASQEELSQVFIDTFMRKLDGQTEKNHVAKTSFHLVREGGAWKIDTLTEDNLDCLTGGLTSVLKGLANMNASASGA